MKHKMLKFQRFETICNLLKLYTISFESCHPDQKNKSVRIYFFYSKAKDSNLKRPRRKMRQSGGLSKSRVSKGAGELLQDGRSRSDMRKSCHPDQ